MKPTESEGDEDYGPEECDELYQLRGGRAGLIHVEGWRTDEAGSFVVCQAHMLALQTALRTNAGAQAVPHAETPVVALDSHPSCRHQLPRSVQHLDWEEWSQFGCSQTMSAVKQTRRGLPEQ